MPDEPRKVPPEERVNEGEYASRHRAPVGTEEGSRSDAAFRPGAAHDRPVRRVGEGGEEREERDERS